MKRKYAGKILVTLLALSFVLVLGGIANAARTIHGCPEKYYDPEKGCQINVIVYKMGTEFYTAEVMVQAAANDLYSSAIGIINDDPAIELLKKDDKKLQVVARKGKLLAKIELNKFDSGNTELIVKADAGKKVAADKELALRIVKRLCDTLGIRYEVVINSCPEKYYDLERGCQINVIAYKKGPKFHTATVLVQAAANDIYNTAIGIVNDDPDVELLDKDDKKLKAEARKGNLLAQIEVKNLDKGNAELIVRADAGKKGTADRELTLRVVKRLCYKLGVKYEVLINGCPEMYYSSERGCQITARK